MDFSKIKEIIIPEGKVKKIVAAGKVIWQKIVDCVNLLPLATDLDRKTILNGVGFKTGTRLSSSTTNAGAEVSAPGVMCTSGFIPAKPGDTVRIKRTRSKKGTASYVMTFGSSNTKLAYQTLHQGDGFWANSASVSWQSVDDNILTVFLKPDYFGSDFTHFRFCCGVMDKYTIVTVNQEITIDSLTQYGFKNWVDFSTTSDGKTIYNGIGWKNGYRVSSDGTEKSLTGGSCTGFIPVNGGDIVRFAGWPFNYTSPGDAINLYDSNFVCIGQAATNGNYGIMVNYTNHGIKVVDGIDSRIQDSNGVWSWVVPPAASGVKYIRVSGYDENGAPGAVMIVTVNEPIT